MSKQAEQREKRFQLLRHLVSAEECLLMLNCSVEFLINFNFRKPSAPAKNKSVLLFWRWAAEKNPYCEFSSFLMSQCLKEVADNANRISRDH